MTKKLFSDEPYLQECEAEVVEVNDRNGIILDRTVFYATGGGQPGDSGVMVLASGGEIAIATTLYSPDRMQIIHVPSNPAPLPAIGEKVRLKLDWTRRYAHMRIHTGLHLLCAVLDYPVTGGSIGAGKGRLDFDIPEAGLDKEEIASKLNELIEADLPVSTRWISDEELDARPELVKTMSVQPPRGAGRVRLVSIEGCDLQPCGGTHVARTGEIGRLTVPKIEKKGGKNRRVRIAFAE